MLNFHADPESLSGHSDGLPAGLVYIESASAALRAYLDSHGMESFQIFQCNALTYQACDLLSVHLPEAKWVSIPSLTGGESFTELQIDEDKPKTAQPGVCRLDRFHVVLARWFWMNSVDGHTRTFLLLAARSASDVNRLQKWVNDCLHAGEQAKWQILNGEADDELIDRVPDAHPPMMDESVRRRVETEIISFFTEPVAAMYGSLAIPYRRGVLLYGPPGNGKTSLIRQLGAALPKVAALILRPRAHFNSDHLQYVINTWTRQAPAMLVIEDLDWMLKHVNVSTFLNLLDGIDSKKGSGLLLIATTNHPEELDPAINNRPGRFDIVMEIPLPSAELRSQYLTRVLPEANESLRATLVEKSEGLSFAHLLELVKLSGLIALQANRALRMEEDILRAMDLITGTNNSAMRAFPQSSGLKIGLQYLGRSQ